MSDAFSSISPTKYLSSPSKQFLPDSIQNSAHAVDKFSILKNVLHVCSVAKKIKIIFL